MTPRLADIQAAFQDRLLTGGDGVLTLLGDGSFMEVYDHAYTARLLEVLAEDFPALHTLLGDEAFEGALRAYLADNPSAKPSIRWIGERLPGWLAETAPWSGQPMLADMAAFEWLLGLAFDAPNAPALEAEALAAVAPEAWPMLAFEFHPALATATISWDVIPFQRAVAAEEDPEAAPQALDGPETWAAWRDPESLMVRFDRLPADEAEALAAARQGADFSRLCELLAESGPADDAAFRAAGMLKTWLDRGWIRALAGDGISWA